MSSTSFLRSASSASRIASWNWLWNSDAMRRTLDIHCPSVRSAPGNSFGPMAISATMPIRSSSLQPISNMMTPTIAPLGASAGLALGGGRSAGHRRARCGLLDRLHRIGLGGLFGLFLFGQALLERFDALGEVAHDVGNLAAPAEQQQADRKQDDPMPNAQAAHAMILDDLGGRTDPLGHTGP